MSDFKLPIELMQFESLQRASSLNEMKLANERLIDAHAAIVYSAKASLNHYEGTLKALLALRTELQKPENQS